MAAHLHRDRDHPAGAPERAAELAAPALRDRVSKEGIGGVQRLADLQTRWPARSHHPRAPGSRQDKRAPAHGQRSHQPAQGATDHLLGIKRTDHVNRQVNRELQPFGRALGLLTGADERLIAHGVVDRDAGLAAQQLDHEHVISREGPDLAAPGGDRAHHPVTAYQRRHDHRAERLGSDHRSRCPPLIRQILIVVHQLHPAARGRRGVKASVQGKVGVFGAQSPVAVAPHQPQMPCSLVKEIHTGEVRMQQAGHAGRDRIEGRVQVKTGHGSADDEVEGSEHGLPVVRDPVVRDPVEMLDGAAGNLRQAVEQPHLTRSGWSSASADRNQGHGRVTRCDRQEGLPDSVS